MEEALKTAVLRAAARLESLSRVSLRESEAAGFAYSCCQAGILISGLFERLGSTRLCQNYCFRAAARLESLSRVSETPGFRKTTVLRAAARLESLSRVSLENRKRTALHI